MKALVLASTKVDHQMSKEEGLIFSSKMAGICYMPNEFEKLMREPVEDTNRRIKQTLVSGHHSVYDHATYTLLLEGIPKILAMILNNEGMYTTSEKSARYTKMKPSPAEKILYEKWLSKFINIITSIYGDKISEYYVSKKAGDEKQSEKHIKKLAQENARYMISVFTPTTMAYTVSLRQLNYLLYWIEEYIHTEKETPFTIKLKAAMLELITSLENYRVPELNTLVKGRTISLFDNRIYREEEFGETYSINYYGSFAHLAQAQRHRTIHYRMRFLDKNHFYVPRIIESDEELTKEWLQDIESVASEFPQGMVIAINERGNYEDFVLKCMERLCGCAQLEITIQTQKTMKRYLEEVRQNNVEVYEAMYPYSKGARCTFPNWKCKAPCIWGSREAFIRKI